MHNPRKGSLANYRVSAQYTEVEIVRRSAMQESIAYALNYVEFHDYLNVKVKPILVAPYSIRLGRYCSASARCATWIASSPARSAIVRASFNTR